MSFRLLVPLLLLVGACDPVHSNAVDDLGGETPNVRRGPLHRPGQPCLVCHDGAIGDPPEFSVAGTILASDSSTTGISGAVVKMTDASGQSAAATSNEAGNFYLSPREYAPVYPVAVSVRYEGVETKMTSLVYSGSCGTCHGSAPGPTSAGRVYPSSDGGVP